MSDTDTRCGRTFPHLRHDTTTGTCPGYAGPLTVEQVHDHADTTRQEIHR